MTMFEEFAKELNVKITIDENGLYSGMCKALSIITTEIIISDDERIFNLPWEQQKEMISSRFFKVFPYMKSNLGQS